MNQQNYNSRISVDVTPQQAIKSISNARGWWATNFTGHSKQFHDRFTVRFGKTFAIIQIVEYIADKKIIWQIEDCYLPLFNNKNQWNGTSIVWEVSSKGHSTEISMTHVGLFPGIECYSDCEKGWDFYTKESLYKLMMEGKGLPGTGIFANISNGERKYEGLIYFKHDPLPDYPVGFFFIDVKETKGEQVTAAFSAGDYYKEQFNPGQLKGEHFMIVENKPVYDTISPFEDILKTINQ